MTEKHSVAEKRRLPVAWDALEDAFENNAPEVHSFLHLENGDVTRIVDGVAEPDLRARVAADPLQLRVNAVSSREQYRWMERFIETVEESEFGDALANAIDGKGAFRRFKDVLMGAPLERERWFSFRSERLRACMEAWLSAHDLIPVERPDWPVPAASEVEARPAVDPQRVASVEDRRSRVRNLVDGLPVRELDAAEAYLEFLASRRRLPRGKTRSSEMPPPSKSGGTAETSEEE